MPNRPVTRSQQGAPLLNMVAEVGRRVRMRGRSRGRGSSRRRLSPEERTREVPTRESIDQSRERVPESTVMAKLSDNNQRSSPDMLNSTVVITTDQVNSMLPSQRSSAISSNLEIPTTTSVATTIHIQQSYQLSIK